MNKAELIEALVKETEMSKAGATRALNAVIDTIVKTVAKKQDVQLIGFGTFKAAKRAAVIGLCAKSSPSLFSVAANSPFIQLATSLPCLLAKAASSKKAAWARPVVSRRAS